MAPEQAAGHTDRLDTRTDVYALGATAYLLLTGQPAHDLTGPRLAVLRRIAAGAVRPPRKLVPDIDPSLDALLMKALAADPAGRYHSAGDLGRDIAAYLAGDPLVARPPTVSQVLARQLRRHRLPVALFAVVLLSLLALATYAHVGLRRERAQVLAAKHELELQERVAVRLAAEADRQRHIGEARLADALLSNGDAMALAGRWRDATARYRDAHQTYRRLGAPTRYADWALLQALAHARPPLVQFAGHESAVRGVALSPDGRLAATGGDDATVRLWDPRTGRLLRTLAGHSAPVGIVAFAPDGLTLLSGSRDRALITWDVRSGARLRTSLGHRGEIWSIAFSPDGRRVATAGTYETRLWDADAGRPVPAPPAEEPAWRDGSSVAFSPDGSALAIGGVDGTLQIRDARGDTVRHSIAVGGARLCALAYSRRGDRVVCGGNDRVVVVVDPATGAVLRRWTTDKNSVTSASFAGPDDTLVRASTVDGTIRTWEVATGRELPRLATEAHAGTVAWSPDGRWALAGGPDGAARVYDLRPDTEVTVMTGHAGLVWSVAVSPDGRLAASAGLDGTVRLWSLPDGRPVRTIRFPREMTAVAFSPDGRRFATGGKSGDVRLCPTDDVLAGIGVGPDALPAAVGAHPHAVRALAFSPDGTRLLSVSGCEGMMWDTATRDRLWTSPAESVLVASAGFSRDGRHALAAGTHGFAAAVDARTGALAYPIPEHNKWGRIGANVAFLSDGRTVFAHSSNVDAAGLWDLVTGNLVRRLDATYHGGVSTVAVSPCDRWGATGTEHRDVRIWDLRDGREVRAFAGHTDNVQTIAMSRDAELILSGGADGTCRLLDVRRVDRYRAFEPAVADARARLQDDPADRRARATLADWYRFRGYADWALDLAGPDPHTQAAPITR